MQTFLPYPDFQESARCLDNKRLWKQCVETKQLVLGQYPNHPAAKMWYDYRGALVQYGIVMCEEAIRRGMSAEDVLQFFKARRTDVFLPSWLGNERFHAAHRSNLLRKDEEHYRKFGWIEPNSIPYVWPV